MNRWHEAFEQNTFRTTWQELISDGTSAELDDETVVTSAEELARFKKAVAFLDGLLNALDPDLTPKSVIDASLPQAAAALSYIKAFQSSRNIAHVAAANDNLDNLLTYIRPYAVPPAVAIDAQRAATKVYFEQFNDFVHGFQKTADQTTIDIAAKLELAEASADQIGSLLETADSNVKLITQYTGTAAEQTADINLARDSAQSLGQEIDALHSDLLVGPQATEKKIKASETEILSTVAKTTRVLASASEKVDELNEFHSKIFGVRHDDDETPQSGLEFELNERLLQLKQLESDQIIKHAALFKQIETLLPGATSAGLASAYKSLKDSFTVPINRFTLAFYGALLLLLSGSLLIVVDSIRIWPPEIKLVQTNDWEYMLRTLLSRAPLVAPVIWLAIYSGTRRSQYERLQQEYAHKEALAASYESYKKQLQDLKVDSDALQQHLISKAIDAISYNASQTLDGDHAEKLPIMQLLNKLSIDEIKKLIEAIKGK